MSLGSTAYAKDLIDRLAEILESSTFDERETITEYLRDAFCPSCGEPGCHGICENDE